MLLCRLAVWQLTREAPHGDCTCEPCQWRRGVEAEADAAFGREWR
jgi:hypothetical protein